MSTLVIALAGFAAMADKVPADNDVKAGWGGFIVFIALVTAVALLGWSLVRHLRKARANAEAGVFGPDSTASTDSTDSTERNGSTGPA